MNKKIKLPAFLSKYEINNESVDEFIEITQIDKIELLNKTFKLLNKHIYDLKFVVDEENLYMMERCILLISFLCSSMEFDIDEIMLLKKRIKKSRESLLIHAKNDDNPELIQLANMLDEIVLDKSFKKEDLILIIKELVDRKENPNIIKRFLNINKEVSVNNILLFDYVFKKTIDSLNNNNENIFYYITLLKLFYTSRIKKFNYMCELNEFVNNKYVDEIVALLNGNKRSLTPEEIINKYKVIPSLPASTIVIPKISTSSDTIITIDDDATNIRDDGLSIKKDGNKYIVKINIADVGSYILPGSVDDTNARINYRNILLNDPVKMLPFNLRMDLSLNQNQKRKVVTMCVVMNDSGDIIDYYLELNDVFISKNITYKDCDKIIGKKSSRFTRDLTDLYYLAEALEYKNSEKKLYWTKKEKSHSDLHVSSSKGYKIIREFMILYNIFIGQLMNELNIPYVFRYQDPEYISTFMKINDIPENDQIRKIIDSIYLDSKFSPTPKYHEGIKTSIYTQSTDPMRKYPDLYNQQLLHKFFFKDIDFPFDYEQFVKDIEYFNQRNRELALMKSEYRRGIRLTKNN